MEGKIWGSTEELFRFNGVHIHRIVINKNGYCSRHKHLSKWNMFYVEIGALKISIEHDNGVIDETILYAGDQTKVPPGVVHRFIADNNTIAYEIYWSETDPSDIHRLDVGGVQNG